MRDIREVIYNVVVLLLTNRCNLQCAHCCLECSPQNNAELDDKLIERLIHDLAFNPKIEIIGISGGEAFLYPEKVKRTIYLINQAGKKASVYTNGFWCNNFVDTYNKLRELKEQGLSIVLTSVDTYHQEIIASSNIKNLLDACNELDISTKIHTSATYSNLEDNDKILSSLGKSKLRANIVTSAVFPVGRAARSIKKEDIIVIQNLERLRCTYDGLCSVDWNGNVLWCCSLHNKNMIIGNVKDENINDILNNIRKNKVFMCILTKGIPYLASIIEKWKLGQLNKSYVNGCELCNSIFENSELLKKLEEII